MSHEEIDESKLESIDTNNNNISQDNTSLKKYICKNCNYYTSRKSQYFRHLETNKHYKNVNQNNEYGNRSGNHMRPSIKWCANATFILRRKTST